MDQSVRRCIEQLNDSNDAEMPQDAAITLEEIKQTIRGLRNSKAPGHDGITNVMIKHLPLSAIKFMVKLLIRASRPAISRAVSKSPRSKQFRNREKIIKFRQTTDQSVC